MNSLLSFIRRKILRIPADRWDYQYANGQWDNLNAESERIDVVLSLMSDYSQPDILEIGCGKAVMFQRMKQGSFGSFTGIDLSQVAINSVKHLEAPNVHFEDSDMHTYAPKTSYDVIAFNESLYYSKDPAALFNRYLQYLKPRGCIIVTAFENKYTAHLWPILEQRWKPSQVETVLVDNHKWSIRMYLPKSSKG